MTASPLSQPIPVLAPMAGYTDLPFRRVCRLYGLHFGTTALIDSGALVHGNPDSESILRRGEEEEFLQVQLLGSIPADLQKATRILRDGPWHFDVLDFNMGCPVQKVLKRKAGAALMKEAALARECLQAIRQEWPGTLTVKMRILDEEDPAPTLEVARRLVDLGVQGIAIHGRLARKVYSGPVHSPIIRALREALPVPVVANGGIFTGEDARRLARETGCGRVMVARGCLGNPWLFREILRGEKVDVPREERLQVMELQLSEMVKEYGERGAMILGRKVISGYVCGHGFPRELRAQVVQVSTWRDFQELLKRLREAPLPDNLP